MDDHAYILPFQFLVAIQCTAREIATQLLIYSSSFAPMQHQVHTDSAWHFNLETQLPLHSLCLETCDLAHYYTSLTCGSRMPTNSWESLSFIISTVIRNLCFNPCSIMNNFSHSMPEHASFFLHNREFRMKSPLTPDFVALWSPHNLIIALRSRVQEVPGYKSASFPSAIRHPS